MRREIPTKSVLIGFVGIFLFGGGYDLGTNFLIQLIV